MKKLKLAIIGQGKSGRNIHGAYYLSEANKYYDVMYVVEREEKRREEAEKRYVGCKTLCDYKELFNLDVDLVVNATTSEQHYAVTKDLLEHGKNVLVEKPFSKTRLECEELIRAAKEHGALLAIFQNTSRSPYYEHILQILKEGKLGKVEQVDVRYNNFVRRWDWQTSQRRLGGMVYNMGPHEIGIAMGILEFSPETKVLYSKLASSHCSGDAEDYVKILLTAPNKPLIDVEMSMIDAYPDYNVKIQGSRGTFKCTTFEYEYKYYTDEENPEPAYDGSTMKDENGLPRGCREELKMHEEKGKYEGTAFEIGTANIYKDIYEAITEKKPLKVTCEMAQSIIAVMETVVASNPLPIKY